MSKPLTEVHPEITGVPESSGAVRVIAIVDGVQYEFAVLDRGNGVLEACREWAAFGIDMTHPESGWRRRK